MFGEGRLSEIGAIILIAPVIIFLFAIGVGMDILSPYMTEALLMAVFRYGGFAAVVGVACFAVDTKNTWIRVMWVIIAITLLAIAIFVWRVTGWWLE